MKYCVVIIDGAAGKPLPQRGGKTTLELAYTPNLDALVKEGTLGTTLTVPPGMEPSSALACMSIMGYDPKVYYRGRSAIEAVSMGVRVEERETVFRCNLVAVRDGKMWDYSAGHIGTEEARGLIQAVDHELGNAEVHFYPGISYRHLLKIKGHEETLEALCTPPHDIPGKAVAEYLPRGPGSGLLLDLMKRSEAVLQKHPVNLRRLQRGEIPATTIWLFWSSGRVPALPLFKKAYGLNAALTTGVDLLRGLAAMAGMEILQIPGVTDGPDNDYQAQAAGAIAALYQKDLVFIHIEAPDEAGHAGSIAQKVEAIEKTDREVISRLRAFHSEALRLVVMPDHPTPIEIQTHSGDPVPVLLWGPGFRANGAGRFSEWEARRTGFSIETGYDIINKLINP